MSPKESYRLPDELWAKIQPLLPVHVNTHRFGGGRPRADDRKCMNAIWFLLRTGCQWNALDATGICPSSTAHDRYEEWVKAGVFLQLWKAGLLECDRKKGLGWAWQALDGAMTKAPLGGEESGPNPTDRAKKGVKRSLLTEAHGVPIGLAVAGANRPDFKMMRATLESIPVQRPKPTRQKPQGLSLDKGFDYDEARDLAKEFAYTAHLRTRGEEAQALKRQAGFQARRWVVERTHSWMNRFRRILIRWEKKTENYLGLLHLACAVIAYRCAGLFG